MFNSYWFELNNLFIILSISIHEGMMAVLIEFQSLIRSTWFLASDFTARQIKGSVKVNNLNQLINFKECRRNIATKGLGNIKKKWLWWWHWRRGRRHQRRRDCLRRQTLIVDYLIKQTPDGIGHRERTKKPRTGSSGSRRRPMGAVVKRKWMENEWKWENRRPLTDDSLAQMKDAKRLAS